MSDDVADRIRELIAHNLGVDHVTDDQLFEHDLGIDSLDVVGLMMAAEDEFEIELSEDAAEGVETVGDAVKLIATLYERAKK